MVKRYNKLEGDLKRDVQSSITNLIKIGCYKGIRHRSKLPEMVKEVRQMLELEKVRNL